MKKYDQLLKKVLSGETNEVSEVCHLDRELIIAPTDEGLRRQLLAFRLALKAGNSQIPVDYLREDLTKDLFLKAEILFFKGAYYGQFHEPDKAFDFFGLAEKAYLLCGDKEKEILSKFNSLMGLSNQGNLKFNEEIEMFNEMLTIARNFKSQKVEFLCRRHLSYKYFDNGNFNEALNILKMSLENTETMTKSDLDLTYIHLADCYLENGDLRKAIENFDKISEVVDERVQFPKAFISSKIFRQAIQIKDYKHVSLYWQNRYIQFLQKKEQLITHDALAKWDQRTGMIWKQKSLIGKIKPLSLEGQLVDLLKNAPRSKSYLCETLWPAELNSDYITDRFHQLILRTNRKVKKLIVFDGQFYRLNLGIKKY